MTDRMDVDIAAAPDETCLDDDFQQMLRSRSAPAIAKEEDLLILPVGESQEVINNISQDQSGNPTEEASEKKQKTSLISNIIGLFSSRSYGDREPDAMDVRRLLECLRDAQARVDLLEKNNEALKNDKKKAGRVIDHLEAELGSFQRENKELSQSRKEWKKGYKDLLTYHNDLKQNFETEKHDHRKEIAGLEAQVNDLTRTKDCLRQMIVPVSEKQLPDSDVVSKFTNLRKGILGFVRQSWKMELQEGVDIRQLPGLQGDFFRSRLPLTYDRTRGVVFQIIHSIIFRPHNYFLGREFEHLEQYMQSVERGLIESLAPDGRSSVIEWRNATFQATQNLRDDGRRLSSTAQDHVWCFLSPLQTKNAAAEQTGRKKLKTVCDDAVELSLMIRQLKDNFYVHDMLIAAGMFLSDCEYAAEEVESVVAADGQQPGTIAYVITGALVKNPKEDLKRTLWLEKTQVAVYE